MRHEFARWCLWKSGSCPLAVTGRPGASVMRIASRKGGCQFLQTEPLGCKPGRAWVLSRFSRVWLFVTLWTVDCQAPLSMGFSRQEYWSALPCPLQGIFTGEAILPRDWALSFASPALAGRFFTTGAMWEALVSLGGVYISKAGREKKIMILRSLK